MDANHNGLLIGLDEHGSPVNSWTDRIVVLDRSLLELTVAFVPIHVMTLPMRVAKNGFWLSLAHLIVVEEHAQVAVVSSDWLVEHNNAEIPQEGILIIPGLDILGGNINLR